MYVYVYILYCIYTVYSNILYVCIHMYKYTILGFILYIYIYIYIFEVRDIFLDISTKFGIKVVLLINFKTMG